MCGEGPSSFAGFYISQPKRRKSFRPEITRGQMCQTLEIVGIRRWRIFSFHYPCSADFLWILLLAGPSDITLLMQLCFTFCCCCCCCSVAKSCPTLCNPMDCSMPGFPVPSPRVCSDSCPLSWWCYLTISSFAALFSFCLQSFPASGSFSMSQLFASGCQSIGTSASVLPRNIQGWFPLELTSLISFQSTGLWRVLFSTTIRKHHFFGAQPSLRSNSHIGTWLLEKP